MPIRCPMPDLSQSTSDLRATIEGSTVTFQNIQEKFEALDEAWSNERPGSSKVSVNSFSYQQIVGMGQAVVPLLLDRLREGEGHWVYALMCITGEKVHTDDMVGDADRVIRAWLDWADRQRGDRHGRLA